MSEEAGVHSRTGAMRDVFASKANTLDGYLKAFPCQSGQTGLLACIDGEVAGFDTVSRGAAYAALHPKLVKSFALDALLLAGDKKPKAPKRATRKVAEDFIFDVKSAKETKYKSVGYGWDHRYTDETLVGSALVHDGTVVHVAFFSVSQGQQAGPMASRRRNSHIS